MFLDRIVAQTRLDLEQRKRDCPLEQIELLAMQQPRPRDLVDAFKNRTRIGLIAEVKRASPM